MSIDSNKALRDYWTKIRGRRQAPTRVEIIPSEISKILPDTFILEAHDENHINYRLAGSRISEMFGKEFRGVNFFDDWPVNEQPILRKYLSELLNKGAIISLRFEAQSDRDHHGTFNMVCLPLTHSGTRIDRILGAISPVNEWAWLGAAPLNFGTIKEINITLERGISLDNRPETTEMDVMPFLPHKRLIQSKNVQLRVFDGGKMET